MELISLPLVLLLIFNIHSGQTKALPRVTVRVTPDSPVFTGETVTLKCEIENQYRPLNWRYRWYKDTTEVFNSERYTVNRDSLTINRVTESDQKYWCKVERDEQTSLSSSSVNLTVKALPRATLSVTPDRSVFTGETVTLKCEIEDQYRSLNWTYVWYKGRTGTSVLEENILSISSPSDQDEFWCRGERDGRPSSSQYSNHVTLSVKGSSSLGLIVGLCLGLFLIFFLVLLWCYKNKKLSQCLSAVSQQKNISRTSDQKQTEDDYISLQTGETHLYDYTTANKDTGTATQAGPSDAVYSQVNVKKNKLKSKDNESESADLTYADIELKPKKEMNTRKKKKKGINSESEDTVYSKLKTRRDQDAISMELISLPLVLLLISNIHSEQTEVNNYKMGFLSSDVKPTLTVQPQTSVFIGDTVTMICEIHQSTGWEFIFINPSNTESTETAGTKTITSVQVSDGGDYWCRARRKENPHVYTQYSEPITVTVQIQPTPEVSVWPADHVFRGDTVTLTCVINGGGVSSWQYSWYKDSIIQQNKLQYYTIRSVTKSDAGKYTCRGTETRGSRYSHISNAVTLTVSDKPQTVLSVSPQQWLTEGDSVTLMCEVINSSTDWTFTWFTVQSPSSVNRDVDYELVSSSNGGSKGIYTVSSVTVKHTGVYMCRAERGDPVYHTYYSNTQTLWITGVSPSVSLIIRPNRSQHFSSESLSLSCEDHNNSTGWTVRRYTDKLKPCSSSVRRSTGTTSTCTIRSLITSDTGVYWCQSESGEKLHPVNISVHNVDVILDSPVHPVTEGDLLTIHCLYRYKNPSNLRAEFYKDESVVQNQTIGDTMIIPTVSKSHEGFYYCKHPERGASPKSWISIRENTSEGDDTMNSKLKKGEDQAWILDPFSVALGSGTPYISSWRGLRAQYWSEPEVLPGEESAPGSALGQNPEHFPCSVLILNINAGQTEVLPRVTVRVTPDRSVFTGQTVTLRCEIEDQYSDWRYLWSNSRISVFNSERYTVNRDSLTINGVTKSDQDEYWCIPGRHGRPQTSLPSSPVYLTVTALPRATVNVTPDRSVFTGETVTLKCEIEDQYSGWRYLWYKGRISVFVGNIYTISSPSDQDEFWCRVERDGRPSSSQYSDHVTLSVKEGPTAQVSVWPSDHVFKGETVNLTCVINGGGVSSWQYSWYKDDSIIQAKKLKYYIIKSVTKSHTGYYTCKGKEIIGSEVTSNAVTLRVSVYKFLEIKIET
ncbi:Fc receptor-like protein 5 [Misgurnus anguillicaudatus]|uniref:Fc receptor-like protein 5 n=1 Tax=Misgurnus anguillicaudatus TaxID=75329 RepID=UPI003CCF0C69